MYIRKCVYKSQIYIVLKISDSGTEIRNSHQSNFFFLFLDRSVGTNNNTC